MLIKRRRGWELPESAATPESVYLNRRALVGAAGALALPALSHAAAKLPGAKSSVPGAMLVEKTTSQRDATTYNNFYEFGLDKDDPVRNAGRLKTRPWTVAVEGEVGKPGSFGIEDLLKLAPMEERVYRMRCVEGWSMVIPWVGFPLAELIKRVEPTGNAKFVEFYTLNDPKQMPGVSSSVLAWPYVEGLRMDEANSPLTLPSLNSFPTILLL